MLGFSEITVFWTNVASSQLSTSIMHSLGSPLFWTVTFTSYIVILYFPHSITLLKKKPIYLIDNSFTGNFQHFSLNYTKKTKQTKITDIRNFIWLHREERDYHTFYYTSY